MSQHQNSLPSTAARATAAEPAAVEPVTPSRRILRPADADLGASTVEYAVVILATILRFRTRQGRHHALTGELLTRY